MHEIIIILEMLDLDMNESLRTNVSLEVLKGTCCSGLPVFLASRTLMHSFSANKLLFISAPSASLLLLFDCVSVALSLPARSTKVNFANSSSGFPCSLMTN